MSTPPTAASDEDLDRFVRVLRRCSGYDFSQYARASLRRRALTVADVHGLGGLPGLCARLEENPDFRAEVVSGLSVPVSEMFRDPPVFRALREQVLPRLASYPHIDIWQAGCAGGEEVYSLAILLHEAGLYQRTHIYATDFNDVALARAQEGQYPVREAALFARNYRECGGAAALSDYFVAGYDHIRFDSGLKRNLTFAHHNLAADGVFCEAQLILCRNVMIYFTDALQNRVLGLFRDSLTRGGFLCLGNKESIEFVEAGRAFESLDAHARLFRLAGVS